MEIGYWLSSEEQGPNNLVANAKLAEEAGFEHVLLSDHIHPWVDGQGHSPFVWGVIGAIAASTSRIRLGTAVTCPLIRLHPAIVAHAATTAQALMDGRFFLGVGTGENLNEHVLGDRWPPPDERLEMLEEAVEVMRLLWRGGEQTHRGRHYTVDHARVYTLPREQIDVYVAASKPNAAEVAQKIGDGLISTAPDEEVVQAFGNGKPRIGMMHCAYDRDAKKGLERATKLWPNLALQGPLGQDLATPSDFEEAAKMVDEEDVAGQTPHGPDPQPYLELIRRYDEAGFTHVYIHQIGDNQDEFAEFAARELLPAVS